MCERMIESAVFRQKHKAASLLFYIMPQPTVNILLVEDNRVNRLVTERLVKRWGYAVTAVGSGAEAILAAERNNFDIILLNLHLPDIQGWDVVVNLRRLSNRYSKVPVIAISADGGKLRQTEQMFSACLQKPYMPEQLQQLIKELEVVEEELTEAVDSVEEEPLQVLERIKLVTQNDDIFEKQLVQLFSQLCAQLISELDLGMLENPDYLQKVRHKQKSSLRLLKLYTAEAALDNLQETLLHSPEDIEAIAQRKQTIELIFGAMQQELNELVSN